MASPDRSATFRRRTAFAALAYAALALATGVALPAEVGPVAGAEGAAIRAYNVANASALTLTALLSAAQYIPLVLLTESFSRLLHGRTSALVESAMRWSGRVGALSALLGALFVVGIVNGLGQLTDAALRLADSAELWIWTPSLLALGVISLAGSAATMRAQGVLPKLVAGTGVVMGSAIVIGFSTMFTDSVIGTLVGLAVFLHPLWAIAFGVSVLRGAASAPAAARQLEPEQAEIMARMDATLHAAARRVISLETPLEAVALGVAEDRGDRGVGGLSAGLGEELDHAGAVTRGPDGDAESVEEPRREEQLVQG